MCEAKNKYKTYLHHSKQLPAQIYISISVKQTWTNINYLFRSAGRKHKLSGNLEQII